MTNKTKEKEANKSLSKDLLESYRLALYKVKDFFDTVVNHTITIEDSDLVDSILKQGEKLGKNIETLAILESKVEKEEAMGDKRRGGKTTSLYEDD